MKHQLSQEALDYIEQQNDSDDNIDFSDIPEITGPMLRGDFRQYARTETLHAWSGRKTFEEFVQPENLK
jgi:hypothetical protein